MAALTDIHIIAPKKVHRYTMIFLHGRDDDPAQFPESVLESETSAPKRELPDVFPSMKWVFLASKMRESLRFKDTIVQVSKPSASLSLLSVIS
jgi:lysophospholipase-2